jgi:hypothetical protein
VWYVTTLGLLFVILVSPAASQPPTLAEQPLVIEGRVLWIDFGTETLMLAPATGGSGRVSVPPTAVGSSATGRWLPATTSCAHPRALP